jgi:pimeloyl-ACP methyl ester carboxylesterase
MFYAHQDGRVRGLVLVNPWARTNSGLAKTTLKHYYRERLMDPALWKKIARGQFEFGKAGRAMLRLVGVAYAGKAAAAAPAARRAPLSLRLQHGIERFDGKVLLIICGADLTGKEFMEMAKATRAWRALLAAPRVTQQCLADADHTFSRRVWRDQIASWTGDWLRTW